MKTKVWDYDIYDYKEVECIGKVRFVGETFFSFVDGKVYPVLGVEGGMIRVVDESEEDYLYDIDNPRPMSSEDVGEGGKWQILDDPTGILSKYITAN